MTTPLHALVAALHDAASYNPGAECAPEAVLWCDHNGEFAPILPALRERVPELLSLGEYDLDTRTGPAVWLRAVVAGGLPTSTLPLDTVPIIYVPTAGREVLKGAEDCPADLQLLVWYTVSGVLFGHVNGKDWTLRAFLTSDRGPVRLTIPDDGLSRIALAQAAARLFSKPLDELRGKRWDADALHALLAPDLAADMLDWMGGTLGQSADPARFAAFASIAEKQLKFDPRKLAPQDAAKRLAKREGTWADVWARFAQATGYGRVEGLLSAEEPSSLFDNQDAYPKQNLKGEDELRGDLLKLADASWTDARERVLALEAAHAWRQETVWAKRGKAPLALALAHLAAVARARSLPAQDGDTLASAYAVAGAEVDGAAMEALAAVSRDIDRNAVNAALRAIYLPWLEEGANALQELVRSGKVKLAAPQSADPAATTLLFVDGLRMDVAQGLQRLLATEGVMSELTWRWSGFPTVTATCKPLVSPVATFLDGALEALDALPTTAEGKRATKPVLYKLLEANGWETGASLLDDAKLWTEAGRFDEEGHALGVRLAGTLASGVRDVADCVLQLLQSGRSVRIVTDHGWLLMPGGLPTAALETGLLEPQGKRSRCAMVKTKAQSSYLQIPWTWNNQMFMATASGARAFFAGQEYAHGGVSPQECVLPVLDIEASGTRSRSVSITEARWEGLRLRIEVPRGADLRADLRLGGETSGPSLIKGGRVLDEKGKTSVLVGDEHEGQQSCLVILDDDGQVLAHRVLTVGGG